MLTRTRIQSAAVALAIIAAGGMATGEAKAQFTSDNVSLHSWLDLSTLSAGAGNDCWGYVSPSGREYALMGLNNKVTVVEITNPSAPVIVGGVSHSSSSWCDIKTYDTYAYAVNESGGGMDVIDLSDVDAGNLSLVQRVTAGGLSTSHNVAINTDSGHLYLLGSNLNGGAPVVFSLANPASPVEVGRWTEASSAYHHDAQIITYTDGPYAGREILFGFSESRGVDIVDVTDKSDITLLSRTPYVGVQYCHQGWVSQDRRYLYANDELDEGSTTATTRTLVFDITDLSAPVFETTFTTGLASRDHNLYVRDCVLYEANYSSGLRIFSIAQPLSPVAVGYFDTHPENNSVNFDGAWSVYPLFPSGTVIVSDIDRGLFVLDVSDAEAAAAALPGEAVFSYPAGRVDQTDALGGTTLQVEIGGTCGAEIEPGTATMHYFAGIDPISFPLTGIGGGLYEAVFPPAVCTQEVLYYFSAETTQGQFKTDPPDAPASAYTAIATGNLVPVFTDDFEGAMSWVTGPDSASTGTWIRGNPVGTGAQPEEDHTPDPGTNALYTGANPGGGLGTDDVDGGTAVVTSPLFDASGGSAVLSYWRWYFERDEGDDLNDGFLAEISNNGGGSWVEIESLSPGSGGWEKVQFSISDLLAPTDQMLLRFSATDGTTDGDIVEAAIDDVMVEEVSCSERSRDLNGDGTTDLRDFANLQNCFTGSGVCPCAPALYGEAATSPCTPADIDVDGDIDATDHELFTGDLTGPE